MLHSQLKTGMTLLQVLVLTRSLGEKVEPPLSNSDDGWRWRDGDNSVVTTTFRAGHLLEWTLRREGE
jgi:hypothetical protein